MAIIEAADELAATAFNINIMKLGNVRSRTLRAFTAEGHDEDPRQRRLSGESSVSGYLS